MRSRPEARRLVAALAAVLGMAACNRLDSNFEEGGYPKRTGREQPFIASASAPNPPPVTAGAAGAGAGSAPVIAANLPAGVTQAMVNSGQELYGTVCVACHGADGGGSAAAPSLTDDEWLWVPGGEYNGLVQIINAGVAQPKQYPGLMPPKGGGNFTDEQVREIAAYVYALSHRSGA